MRLKSKPPKKEKVVLKKQKNKDQKVPNSDLDPYGEFALVPELKTQNSIDEV